MTLMISKPTIHPTNVMALTGHWTRCWVYSNKTNVVPPSLSWPQRLVWRFWNRWSLMLNKKGASGKTSSLPWTMPYSDVNHSRDGLIPWSVSPSLGKNKALSKCQKSHGYCLRHRAGRWILIKDSLRGCSIWAEPIRINRYIEWKEKTF